MKLNKAQGKKNTQTIMEERKNRKDSNKDQK